MKKDKIKVFVMKYDIELIKKIEELVEELKTNKNSSSLFFEKIIEEIQNNNTRNEALEKLKHCYAITQYANFSYKEEKMLDKILEMLND